MSPRVLCLAALVFPSACLRAAEEAELEVLARLDPREAEPLLQVLAKGPPDDHLTREAKLSLQRLSGRPGEGKAVSP